MFSPPQVQFGISCREAGDESADLSQMQEESAHVADMSGVSTDNAGPPSFGRSSGKTPKMPYFDEERDFVDNYLGRFQRFATCQRWKLDTCVVSDLSHLHHVTAERLSLLRRRRRHHLDNDDKINRGGRIPNDSVITARSLDICSTSVQVHGHLEGPGETRTMPLGSSSRQDSMANQHRDRLNSNQDLV